MTQEAVEGPSVPRVLRCRYCGAPLPPSSPDAAVVVCPSCGRPNWLRGSGRLLIVQARGLEEAAGAFEELAGRDPDLRKARPAVARVEIVYIPFYAARGVGVAFYDYRGYVTRTRTVRRGDRWETVTETRPFHLSGVYREGFAALLLARRGLGEPAAGRLAEHYLSSMPRPVEPERVELGPGVEALAAELEPGEAAARLRMEALDWLRGRVEAHVRAEAAARYGGAVTVTHRRVDARVEGFEHWGPVLLPLVKVFYVAEGRVYRAFFSGWDLRPLLREEPFTTAQRVAVAAVAGAASGGIGAAGLGYAASAGEPLLGLLGLAAGAVVGYIVSRAAMRATRLEEGGAQSWVSSLPETIESVVRRTG